MPVRSTNTVRYDSSGRKRKTVAFKRTKKYRPPFKDYKPECSIADERIAASRSIKSAQSKPTPNEGRLRDKTTYTGSKILGIATMHKSNAVPVSSQEMAEDIAKMAK